MSNLFISSSGVSVLESKELLVLIVGPVHHVVLSKFGGVVWVGVVLSDDLLVGQVDALSEVVLLECDVTLSVGVQVVQVLEFVGGNDAHKGSNSEFH